MAIAKSKINCRNVLVAIVTYFSNKYNIGIDHQHWDSQIEPVSLLPTFVKSAIGRTIY